MKKSKTKTEIGKIGFLILVFLVSGSFKLILYTLKLTKWQVRHAQYHTCKF